MGSLSVIMGTTIYIGLCVCAKSTTALNTATFANVSLTGSLSSAVAAAAPVAPPPLAAGSSSDLSSLLG